MSNLPPGVTDAMIDEAFERPTRTDADFICGECCAEFDALPAPSDPFGTGTDYPACQHCGEEVIAADDFEFRAVDHALAMARR